MILVWDLIKKFMRDTEIANNMTFADSAWQRAKQLEADILARDNESDEQHRAEMVRARDDADRVGAARIAFEDGQQKRIEAYEALLIDTLEPLEAAGTLETDPEGLIMRIKNALGEKAIGPG